VTLFAVLVTVLSLAAAPKTTALDSFFEPLWLALDFSSPSELNQLHRVSSAGSATEPAIVDGALFLRSDSSEVQQIAVNGGSNRNFHVTFRYQVQWAGSKSSCGLYLRSNAARKFRDGIKISFHPARNGKRILTEVVESRTGRIRKTGRLGVPDDLWHQCEIVLWDGRCRLYVDGAPVLVAGGIPVSRGGLGLFVGQGTRLWLDDLTVSVE
jgi:hypothetical protein